MTSLIVTNFASVMSLGFRGGTYDESDGLEIEPSSEMEPVMSGLISYISLISKNCGTTCIRV